MSSTVENYDVDLLFGTLFGDSFKEFEDNDQQTNDEVVVVKGIQLENPLQEGNHDQQQLAPEVIPHVGQQLQGAVGEIQVEEQSEGIDVAQPAAPEVRVEQQLQGAELVIQVEELLEENDQMVQPAAPEVRVEQPLEVAVPVEDQLEEIEEAQTGSEVPVEETLGPRDGSVVLTVEDARRLLASYRANNTRQQTATKLALACATSATAILVPIVAAAILSKKQDCKTCHLIRLIASGGLILVGFIAYYVWVRFKTMKKIRLGFSPHIPRILRALRALGEQPIPQEVLDEEPLTGEEARRRLKVDGIMSALFVGVFLLLDIAAFLCCTERC